MPPKLPDKLSDLILVAIADLTKAERSPRYRIDMATWHRPNAQCAVCLAGAVMAFTLRIPKEQHILPDHTSTKHSRSKLLALDEIRCGRVRWALNTMGIKPPPEISVVLPMPSYAADAPGRRKFKAALRPIARHLREHGL